MIYFLIAIALYAISLLWIGVASPWLDEQFKDQERWRLEQERILKERIRERLRQDGCPEVGISQFLKFAFPLLRKASEAIIADALLNVRPIRSMAGQWSLQTIEYLQEMYGKPAEHDMIQMSSRELQKEMDREVVLAIIVDEIIRETFADHPYSSFYVQPAI